MVCTKQNLLFKCTFFPSIATRTIHLYLPMAFCFPCLSLLFIHIHFQMQFVVFIEVCALSTSIEVELQEYGQQKLHAGSSVQNIWIAKFLLCYSENAELCSNCTEIPFAKCDKHLKLNASSNSMLCSGIYKNWCETAHR